jgi:hypothetical protein
MTTRTLVGSGIALMVAIAITPVHAAAIQLQQVISGLSNPVFVTNAGDGSGRLFVLEQPSTAKRASSTSATWARAAGRRSTS